MFPRWARFSTRFTPATVRRPQDPEYRLSTHSSRLQVWAKSEILVSEVRSGRGEAWTNGVFTLQAYADSLQTLQLLCHLTDVTLWPYIQLPAPQSRRTAGSAVLCGTGKVL